MKASPKAVRQGKSIIADLVTYKVVDSAGHIYAIRAERTIESITKALEGKVSKLDPSTTRFKYFDDEGDEIVIKSDECLEEAVRTSAHAGSKSVKLTMSSLSNNTRIESTVLIAGVAALAAAIGIGVMVLLKPKK